MWEKYKIGNKKFDLRFHYYKNNLGNGNIRYERIVKKWYSPIYNLGNNLYTLVYKIHNKFGKRAELTEHDYEKAREYASERVSYEEYLDMFSKINPWGQKPWSIVLWWIRKNITFD